MILKGIYHTTINQLSFFNEKNAEKQQECVDKYIQAKNLPRKQKKKVRKYAQKDYNFWLNLDAWQKNTFGI